MNICRLFWIMLFYQLPFLSSAQNHISISVINGPAIIKYFPPAKTFANIFYSYQITGSNGQYVINLKNVTNKELSILINNQDIYVYVGVNDTISIIYDEAKKSYSFSGDNAMLNEIYNLENSNRFQYKYRVEEFFFKCSRNFGLYQIYYSTMYPNDLKNASPWLSNFGYIFHAPAEIRDFILQTNYIGNYNSARDYFNWCSIYSELEQHFSEIYYTDFFQNHKPCKSDK